MANADGLERMKELLTALGDPQKDLSIIHVAGTNGKGSTCVMIASILQEAGYSVGLYTSPHLETECERIQIWSGLDRRMIGQSELDALRDRVKSTAESIHLAERMQKLTVFETYTAAAYLYFAEKKPDYVILECGMGGRLDSSNTIERPIACVITKVGLDHTDELGSTIEEVACNKAGIIKEGVPVVSQSEDDAVRTVIKNVAFENGSEFIDVAEESGKYGYLMPAMQGEYQKKNAVTAALAVKAAGIEVSREDLIRGISKAVLPGRFEILNEGSSRCKENEEPLFIVDGAHNPDAMRELVKEYRRFSKERGIIKTKVIFGCMQDKNSSEMVKILTSGLENCDYLTVSIDYGRAESAEKIAEMIGQEGCKVNACASLEDAFDIAMSSGAGCILVAGSIYIAGEMRSIFKNAR